MEYYLYLLITPVAFAVICITITITLKYRHEPLGESLLVYFFLIALFMMSNVFELIAGDEFWILFWTKLQISLYAFVPVAWFIFAQRFSKSAIKLPVRLPQRAVFAVPLLTTLFVWTYPLNSFFYKGHQVVSRYGFSTLKTDRAFFFWVFGVHSYLLLILGVFLITRQLLSRGPHFHRLSIIIFIGSIFPLSANILYILPLPFFIFKDFTPLAFALSGFFFFIGIFWHRFLEIIPIARNTVVEEMEQGVIILDKDDKIIDINHSASNILNLKKSILGMELSSVDELWPYIQHSYRKDECVFEGLIGTGDEARNCNFRIKPIRQDQEEQYGILITIDDISLLTSLYDEKMRLIALMEDTYNKLNSTQLQLIHKEKLASIGQISAGMAHEIKNPLSFMQSNHVFLTQYIKTLSDMAGIDSKKSELMFEIDDILFDFKDGLRRILDVVNDLLSFSRDESKQKLDINFDINNSLDQSLRILKGTINPGIKIVRKYGDLPPISCYGGEINQVFLNLLNNAIHATNTADNEQKKVVIRTKTVLDRVVVDILNTGKTINPELRQKVFEPFYTTKPSGKGTGLGLSIASDIVIKRHNGGIEVLEEEGMTLFRVTLNVELESVEEIAYELQ